MASGPPKSIVKFLKEKQPKQKLKHENDLKNKRYASMILTSSELSIKICCSHSQLTRIKWEHQS
jgi:hypothetical protein